MCMSLDFCAPGTDGSSDFRFLRTGEGLGALFSNTGVIYSEPFL